MLGRFAEQSPGACGGVDARLEGVLGFLYEREYAGAGREQRSTDERNAGLGPTWWEREVGEALIKTINSFIVF